MIENKYYIVNLPEPGLDAIVNRTDVVATSVDNIRYNKTGTKALIKTKIGATRPTVLDAFPEYDHAGIKVELAKSEWNSEV